MQHRHFSSASARALSGRRAHAFHPAGTEQSKRMRLQTDYLHAFSLARRSHAQPRHKAPPGGGAARIPVPGGRPFLAWRLTPASGARNAGPRPLWPEEPDVVPRSALAAAVLLAYSRRSCLRKRARCIEAALTRRRRVQRPRAGCRSETVWRRSCGWDAAASCVGVPLGGQSGRRVRCRGPSGNGLKEDAPCRAASHLGRT